MYLHSVFAILSHAEVCDSILSSTEFSLYQIGHHTEFSLLFTAMLAQHVASELRMYLWPSRSLTDRNTPSRLKIDLVQSGYNGFLSYNGYNGF